MSRDDDRIRFDGGPDREDGVEGIDPASIDTGEPIAELAELTAEAPQGFFGRLWQRIDRRRLGGEVMDFGWHGLFAVFAEFLNMAMEIFRPGPAARDETGGETGDGS